VEHVGVGAVDKGEMKPYYEHAGITIYHGDCRDVLPDVWFGSDLMLTDPPYGIGCDKAIHIEKPSRPSTYLSGPKYEAGDWDSARPSRQTFDLLLGSARNHIIWGGNYFADMLPPSRGWLFWDKMFDRTFNLSHGELAWTSFDSRLLKFTISSKAETSGGRLRVHPTQKPVALMRWCIGLSPNCSAVIDPFMGSGSVMVAAKESGCSAIGIEVEERYCEIAARRLSQAVLFGYDADVQGASSPVAATHDGQTESLFV
jgi:hypothetical protein